MLTAAAAGTMLVAAPSASAATPERASGQGWSASWAASAVPRDDAGQCTDCTVRNTAHLSIGGPAVRVRLANPRPSQAITITTTTVSRPASRDAAGVQPGSLRGVTFKGARSVRIPPASVVTSDPVPLSVAPGSDLQVSVFAAGAAHMSPHALGTRSSTWLATGPDRAASPSARGFTNIGTWTYVASEVDVATPQPLGAGTVVAFGDSITDGVGVEPGTDTRWPDYLASRLRRTPGLAGLGMANAGISGNCLTIDQADSPSGEHRFTRDALDVAGARTVIIFEGINDIQNNVSAARITESISSLAARAHARGLRVVGATVTPFNGFGSYTPAREKERQTVNSWIRTTKALDAALDFDAVVRDQADPTRMQSGYDSGDHLHPNSTGYRAISGSVDLTSLVGHGRAPSTARPAPQPER